MSEPKNPETRELSAPLRLRSFKAGAQGDKVP